MYRLNHWIPAFAGMTGGDSDLRRVAMGFLGGLFPTPLYHGSAKLPERPASMQACPLTAYGTSSAARSRRGSTTYIPVGVSINDDKGGFRLSPA